MWKTSYNKERAKDIITMIANKQSKFFCSKNMAKMNDKYTTQQIGHVIPFLKEMQLIDIYNENTRNNLYVRTFSPADLPSILNFIDDFVPKELEWVNQNKISCR